MTTHTTWITIGHATTSPTSWTVSTSDEPPWADRFDADVRQIVTTHGGEVITEAETVGEWAGEQEFGRAFLVTYPPTSENAIRGSLSHLAWKYGQDAIGFVGTSGGDLLIKEG